MEMIKKILAVNAGSSSLKFKLFSLKDEQVLAHGQADRIGLPESTFVLKLANGEVYQDKTEIRTQEDAVEKLLSWLTKSKIVNDLSEIAGVGHRVVAGGEYFAHSTLIDQDNLQKIYELNEYAPLHNCHEADGIKAFMKLLPNVPQVGVFDTSIHQTLDQVHYMYSLPYEYYEKYKVRKYGAHGTSVRYVSQRIASILKRPLDELNMVICHLGSGVSITAVKNGQSYDTSMGFSPLAGVTMSSRSGDIDPSALQYILGKETDLNFDQMIDILNNKSGLLGISGISPDMWDIRKAISQGNERASLARNIFINRIVRYIGAYYLELQGIDVIAFTAGVGENDIGIRKEIMNQMSCYGLIPDYDANQINGIEKIISAPNSKIVAMVIPTDEELMIARDVVRIAKISD